MTTIKPAIEIAARAAVARRTEDLFRSSGALREGHFQLKSGRHGDAYVEKFAVLSDPAATSELCGFWAGAFGGEDGEEARVDLVAGPTTGGIILAFETGRQLGVRAIFAEEVRDRDGSTHREFRRGFRIEPGERVLLVALGVGVIAVVLVAVAATGIGGPGRQVETGIVVSVDATSLSQVHGFSIRTTDGRTFDFRIVSLENASNFPPGHLAEHKVSLA